VNTLTAETLESTVYGMVAVFPEYVMLPDNVGAANCLTKVCAADGALSRPLAFGRATTTIFIVLVNSNEIVAVVPLKDVVVPEITELSAAFLTCTAVTPESTMYVMLTVFPEIPEYVMLPDNVGAANCLSKICVVDAARPAELPKATITMLSGETAFVNGTVNDTVVPLLFDSEITVSDAFFTCTAVTSGSTAYVMAAVYDPALTSV
jgi:hypothetical protein